MDQVKLNNLLQSIKSDDLVLFSNLVKGNENISYGRFPLLSLCYMYGARKIQKYFFDVLRKIKVYNVVIEPLEIYQKFKSVAGRTLRLYIKANAVVSPLEMLAILHKDKIVKHKYADVAQNSTINKNLITIYKIHGQKATLADNKIKITMPKLTSQQKSMCIRSAVLATIFMISIISAYGASIFALGMGNEKNPFKITSQSRLYQALNSGEGYYTLSKDIKINDFNSEIIFSGNLDGNGHTIYVDGLPSESLIGKNLGNINNVNIVYSDTTAEVSNSLSLLVKDNEGVISNVKVSCNALNLTFNKSSEKDLYFGALAINNKGVIDNCNVDINATLTGAGDGECMVGGVAGVNESEIKNTTFVNGSISTSVIDVAGIVGINSSTSKIINCTNNANISQSSNINNWNPNASGICVINYGTIEHCFNNGTIFVDSTITADSVGGSAFVSGISATNFGMIKKSLNKGEIKANSKQLMVYAGGISASSEYTELNFNRVLSVVDNCGNTGLINISTEHEYAYVFSGGITGYAYAKISNCYSIGKFTNGFNQDKYYVGSCIGASDVDVYGYIYIDGGENYMLLQETTPNHIGALIYSGYDLYGNYVRSIVEKGVDINNDNGIIMVNKTIEEIKQQEVYWYE